MSDRELETLSAFVDGEAVDPDGLALALATADARDFLVDCARLRAEVRTTESPSTSWIDATRHRLSGRPPLWLAAAGVTAVLLAGMLWIARPTTTTEAEVLPEPDRVIKLERGRDWIG